MIHLVNNAAVIRHGDSFMIMLDPLPEVTYDLRELLAKVNSDGLGDIPEGVRQLLTDLEAALQAAYRPTRVLRSWKPGDDVG